MFCSECGKKNVDHAKFCVECGTAISTKVQERAESEVNSNINITKNHVDSDATEKLRLFNEEVIRLRLIYEENSLERQKWLKKNGKRFRSNIEGVPLEKLQKTLAIWDEDESKAYSVLSVVIRFIIIAIIAYFAKAYLLLWLALFGLLVYGATRLIERG